MEVKQTVARLIYLRLYQALCYFKEMKRDHLLACLEILACSRNGYPNPDTDHNLNKKTTLCNTSVRNEEQLSQ